MIFNHKKIIDTCDKGDANKSLDIDFFNNIQIPIPPLEIQNVIVQELDSMYKQKEGFQSANNNMNIFRKAKFELLLSKCEDKQYIKLDDECNIKTGKNKPIDGLAENKKYPYYGTGGITGYTDEFIIDGDYLLTPINGSVVIIFLCNGKSFPSDHMYIIQTKNNVLIKFLNYSLIGNNIAFHKTCAIIPNITKEILSDITITIPSLQDQQKIVEQMEKYDKLVEL